MAQSNLIRINIIGPSTLLKACVPFACPITKSPLGDFQPGAYFVTIVAWHRECLFGEVVDGEMRLSKFGLVAKQQWEKLPKRFPKDVPVWQRNYYEHIMRYQKDLQNKTDYIEADLWLWVGDDENPINIDP